jgi:hypothetical protein
LLEDCNQATTSGGCNKLRRLAWVIVTFNSELKVCNKSDYQSKPWKLFRRGRGLFEAVIQNLYGEAENNHENLKISSVAVEIRTENFSNTSRELYRCANLLFFYRVLVVRYFTVRILQKNILTSLVGNTVLRA